MSNMRYDQLFENQDELLQRQEDIYFEISEAGGEVTPDQELELDSIQKEFDRYEKLILEFPDKIGFLMTRLNKSVEDAKEWQDRIYKRKKAREKKVENFKAWIGRTIRNVNGADEKIKGEFVTIKDITKENYVEVIDKNFIPIKYQDATFAIPSELYTSLSVALSKVKIQHDGEKKSLIELLESFRGKNSVNESRAKAAYSEENKIPGMTSKTKYNCQFWGLNKINN